MIVEIIYDLITNSEAKSISFDENDRPNVDIFANFLWNKKIKQG